MNLDSAKANQQTAHSRIMHTQCPHCDTVFRIQVADLTAAQGIVRCSQCQRLFNALETLQDSFPEGSVAEPSGTEPTRPKSLDRPRKRLVGKQKPFPGEGHTPQARPAYRGTKPILWSVGILILLAALALQAAYHQRASLSSHMLLRPWIQRLCTALACEVPPIRDLASIRILERDVRQHPSEPSAFLVNITLSNMASFIQPFPEILFSLTRADRTEIARRLFQPDEYLPPEIPIERGMPPSVPVQVVLELAEPSGEVSGFRFVLQ